MSQVRTGKEENVKLQTYIDYYAHYNVIIPCTNVLYLRVTWGMYMYSSWP